MSIIETKKCRICGNKNLKTILNLGNQPLSSVFPKENSPDPSVSPLELIICSNDVIIPPMKPMHMSFIVSDKLAWNLVFK